MQVQVVFKLQEVLCEVSVDFLHLLYALSVYKGLLSSGLLTTYHHTILLLFKTLVFIYCTRVEELFFDECVCVDVI